jgi:hypothetical protein
MNDETKKQRAEAARCFLRAAALNQVRYLNILFSSPPG